MSLQKAASIAANADGIERDLMAARTGARLTLKVTRAATPENHLIYCANCGALASEHETPFWFCPENALRAAWGDR